MTSLRWASLLIIIFAPSLFSAQCTKDHRTNKSAGIVVTDFNITGTQTISATDLAGITGAMIGGCYDDDSDELEQRVRALFQDRGYFQVEVKSLRGYRDFVAVPETTFSSNATVDLRIVLEEGPQYHLGKVDIFAEKERAARLRAAWKLAEGDVYDNTYLDDFLAAAYTLLPANFSRANVQIIQNCPEALIHLRLIVDPTQNTSESVPKSVPCEENDKESK